MREATAPSVPQGDETRPPHATLTALAVLGVIDVRIRRRRDRLDATLEAVRVISARRQRVLRRYLGDDYAASCATVEGDPGASIASALARRCGATDCSADLLALADALRAIADVDTELAQAMIRCHRCWTQANAYLDRCAELSREAARMSA
jgi:hypothetical protein